MTATGRYGKAALWAGAALAALEFGLLDGLLRAANQRGALRALDPLAGVWWVVLGAGLVLALAGNRSRVAAAVAGDASVAGDAPSRHEIVTATNWRHENRRVLQRSLGLALLAASAVGGVAAVGFKEGTSLFASYEQAVGVVVLAAVAGGALFVASTRATRHIHDDYTHRVSVRLPDLFSVHSFHVHLRQQAEDLGYAVRHEASPERSGASAGYDDSIFLSEGGFTARKRPIPPSDSLIDDDTIVGEIASLSTVGVVGVVLGLVVALAPGSLVVEGVALKLPLAAVLVAAGAGVAYKDYLDRTNHWAELYCVTEGTVYNPETNLYDDHANPASERATPRVSDSESSCELVVTLGAGCSPSFDERQLKQEFEAFAESVGDLAAANQYRVAESEDAGGETASEREQRESRAD